MAPIIITVQNISGNIISKNKVGGKICPLKLNIHKAKPSIIILTETRHVNFDGHGIFKGYKLAQSASSGGRSAGVLVFMKNGIEIIEGSAFNDREGRYCVGCYEMNGNRIIIGAIYGSPEGNDGNSMPTFVEVAGRINTLCQVNNTRQVIIGGDFNLHLDTCTPKGRTCKFVNEMIQEFRLIDSGKEDKTPTWRRPNRPGTKSRLDYILHSECMQGKKAEVAWSQLDHAQVTVTLQVGKELHKKRVYKDWVLTQPEFINQAQSIIKDTLIDHSQHSVMSAQEREENIVGKNKEFEGNLILTDQENGIFTAHVFSIIIQRLVNLQGKIQKDMTQKKLRELADLQNKIAQHLREYDTEPDEEVRKVKQQVIENARQELSQEAENYERAKKVRIEQFYLDNNGKNRAASFIPVRESRSHNSIKKLKVSEEEEVTDLAKIVTILEDKHKKLVGTEFKQHMELEEFLDKYQVELPILKEATREILDTEFTMSEVKEALSQAAGKSAPGPSGQSVGIFKFIFSEIPLTMTVALNELTFVPGFMDSPCFAWIKQRYITYIPKVGKIPDRPDNLRPLSLLESFYKVKTRILSNRLIRTLDEALCDEQHGFRPGRSTQTCSLPFMEAIQEAERTGKPLQLLAVDIKAAFDSISPEAVRQVMEKQQYPEIYTAALHKLTGTGEAMVLVNAVKGNQFKTKSGTGQGDPPSAPRYDIGSDPIIRALTKVTQESAYKFESGNSLPIGGYADDHMLGLQVRGVQDIKNVIEVYEDYQKVSGLQINVKKTEILCINTDASIMAEIEQQTGIKCVDGLRHLGIEVRKTYKSTVEATNAKVMLQTESKCKRINKSFTDMFHRKQLIQQVILPSYNHCYMTLGYDSESGGKLDKKVIKLLWTQEDKDGEIKQKRIMVAKQRIGVGHEFGGLQLQTSEEIATGLGCNFIQRCMKNNEGEKKLFMTSRLNDLLIMTGLPNLAELYQTGGSNIWKKAQSNLKKYSAYLAFACGSMAKLLELNERSQESKFTASIAGNAVAPPVYAITPAESVILKELYGFEKTSQLFLTDNLTGKIDLSKDCVFPVGMEQRDTGLVIKCRALRRELGGRGGFIHAPTHKCTEILQKGKFSYFYRKIKRQSNEEVIKCPPSYKTRIKDGYAVPSLAEYMKGYKKLFKMDLPSKTIENSFNILNRQTWTNQKEQWKNSARGEDSSNECRLCGGVENTNHLLFDCTEYPEIVWDALKDALNLISDTGNRITVHMFNIMYNTNIRNLPEKMQKQVGIIIQEFKRSIIAKRYARCTNENLNNIIYDRDRVLAHWIIICKKVISFRRFQGKDKKVLEDLKSAFENMLN